MPGELTLKFELAIGPEQDHRADCSLCDLDRLQGTDPELIEARERMPEPATTSGGQGEPYRVPALPGPGEWVEYIRDGAFSEVQDFRWLDFQKRIVVLPDRSEFWAWVAERDGRAYL